MKEKNKIEILKEHIKSKIRIILAERKLKEKEEVKNLARIGLISKRFPGVKQSLEKLMSNSFAYYVKDISIISPKPTTFRIVLNNNLDFELKYTDKTYIAKVSGKKYYLKNTDEIQNASNSITELLSLSPAQPEEQKQSQQQNFDQGLSNDFNNMSAGGGLSAGGPEPTGLPELQPEEIPTTPAAGGEVGGENAPAPATPSGGVGNPNL